ncbi:MAG: delta-60 repeat domain-containing protein, partial [Myxococcota bacterium]
MNLRAWNPWLAIVALGCGNEEMVEPELSDAVVLRPRLEGPGDLEIRSPDAPGAPATLTADETGAFSVFTSATGLAVWAEAIGGVAAAEACSADLAELGELDALCVFLDDGASVTVDLTAAPARPDDVATWSELDRMESGCIATERADTIRCTLDQPGQRVVPLVTFAPEPPPEPEPEPFRCPSVTITTSGLRSMAPYDDDKLVVVGWFDGFAKRYAGPLRYDEDGQLETCFDGPADFGSVYDMAVHPDGGYLVSGFFAEYGGEPCRGLAKLDGQGQVDPTFCPSLPGDIDNGYLEVEDGIAYVVWNTRAVALDLETLTIVARSDLFTLTEPFGFIEDITLHDGVLYVVGRLTQVGDEPRIGFAAFDASDLSLLDAAPVFDDRVRTIEARDDQLWVGGEFTTVDGAP